LWNVNQIQSAIALLMSRQNLMRDEAASLWLEATIIELTPVNKENPQPWESWKSPQDAMPLATIEDGIAFSKNVRASNLTSGLP
jgi:DNA polymerase III gamma/tau subunit